MKSNKQIAEAKQYREFATLAATNAAQSLSYHLTGLRKRRGRQDRAFHITVEANYDTVAELHLKRVIYELKYRMQRYGIEDFEYVGGTRHTASINITIAPPR